MIALLCALAISQPSVKTEWVMKTENAGFYEGDLFFRVNLKGLEIKEWAIFIPKAPEMPGIQTQVETTPFLVGSTAKPVLVKDYSLQQRPIYQLRLPVQGKANKEMVEVRVKYKGSLNLRKLEPKNPDSLPTPPVPPLKEAEKTAYLAEWGDIKFKDKEFQIWLDNNEFRIKPGEGEIDFARRLFLRLEYMMTFDVATTMDRRTNAVIGSLRSDGGGITNVYVAALRANKIPARGLWGRWMVPEKNSIKSNNVNFNYMGVKADFFAPGVGWVPADPGSALFEKKRTEPGKFFGAEPAPFLTQHLDPSLGVFNPLTKKRMQMIGLQVPGYWALAPAGSTATPEFFQEWKATQPMKTPAP